MKKINALLQISLILFSLICFGQSKEQKIENILNSTGILEGYQSIFEYQINSLKNNTNKEDSIKLIEIEKKIADGEITKRLSKACSETFSDKEIDDIYIFLNSETGKKFVENSAEVLNDKIQENLKDIHDEIAIISDNVRYNIQEKQENSKTEEPVPTDKEDGFYEVISYSEDYFAAHRLDEIVLADQPSIVKSDILSAQRSFDQLQRSTIEIQLTKEGAEKFKNLTEKNVGKPIAMVFGKKILSAPIVNEPIPNGKVQISGNFSIREADELAEEIGKK
ncbi:MAG: hypothetical protein LBE36_09470 [Flavobacteriaceae bacterium]|jgi:preprotein translocase subunit SecD|nr:hypothetical protein [Flavobacteriaceae bacterium]